MLTREELDRARKLHEDAVAAGRHGEEWGVPRDLLGKLVEAAGGSVGGGQVSEQNLNPCAQGE